MVRERDHICGPITNPAARLKIGAAEARPVGNDNPDLKLLGQRLSAKQVPFEPGAGRPVKIEDWRTVGFTMFVISEQTASGQAELLVGFGNSLAFLRPPRSSDPEGQLGALAVLPRSATGPLPWYGDYLSMWLITTA